jgi:hypothetical protein
MTRVTYLFVAVLCEIKGCKFADGTKSFLKDGELVEKVHNVL